MLARHHHRRDGQLRVHPRAGAPECTLGGAKSATENYQDLWWNSDESGWGVNIAHQGDILFATWYTYDAQGKGLWLVMSNTAKSGGSTYSGAVLRAYYQLPVGNYPLTNEVLMSWMTGISHGFAALTLWTGWDYLPAGLRHASGPRTGGLPNRQLP